MTPDLDTLVREVVAPIPPQHVHVRRHVGQNVMRVLREIAREAEGLPEQPPSDADLQPDEVHP